MLLMTQITQMKLMLTIRLITLIIGLILKKLGIEMLIERFYRVLSGGIVHSCYRSVLSSVDSRRVEDDILRVVILVP
jgi:hypothetical protein